MYAEAVPSRKKKCHKEDEEEKVLEQPYDSRPTEIKELYARFRYKINEASSTVVDLELGRRNVKEFIKRYRNNNRYIFIKIFTTLIYSAIKHDGCIVTGRDREVEKLVVFV
jgi:predicted transcriptional regulator